MCKACACFHTFCPSRSTFQGYNEFFSCIFERERGGFHTMFASLYRLLLTHPVVHGRAVAGFCCIPQVVSVYFFPLSYSFLLIVCFLFFKFLFTHRRELVYTLTGVNLQAWTCVARKEWGRVRRVIRNVTCRSHQLWRTTKWSPQARHRRDCGGTGYVPRLVCLPYSTVKVAGVSATSEEDSSAQYHAVRARTPWSELEVNCVFSFFSCLLNAFHPVMDKTKLHIACWRNTMQYVVKGYVLPFFILWLLQDLLGTLLVVIAEVEHWCRVRCSMFTRN